MAPRKKLKAENTVSSNFVKPGKSSKKLPPSDIPLLKRTYKKTKNIVKVSPFPKQAVGVIVDNETKETTKMLDSTPKKILLKSNKPKRNKRGQFIKQLKKRSSSSEVVPAIYQEIQSTSEHTLLTKRKRTTKLQKLPRKEIAKDLNSYIEKDSNSEKEPVPKVRLSLNLSNIRLVLVQQSQLKVRLEADENKIDKKDEGIRSLFMRTKQHEESKSDPISKQKTVKERNTRRRINTEIKTITAKRATRRNLESAPTEGTSTTQVKCENYKEVGNERKRKTISQTNKIKVVKRQKVSKPKLNCETNDISLIEIEKTATAIEQRLADEKQQMLPSNATHDNKGLTNKLHTVKRRVIKTPLEPDSFIFTHSKKRGRKNKSLGSDSCETFTSQKSSSRSDTFSWTKEISSSSTSFVTVTSNDYVCIDRKLPIIKLHNIERSSPDTTVKTPEPFKTHSKKTISLSGTETESSMECHKQMLRADNVPLNTGECSSNLQTTNSSPILRTSLPQLNLSTSTSPSQMQSVTDVTTENDTDITSDTDISKNKFIENYLQIIEHCYDRKSAESEVSNTKLKRIDLGFIECLGKENTMVLDIDDKSYKVYSNILNEEIAAIQECQLIKKKLSKFLLNKEKGSQDASCSPDYLSRKSTLTKNDTDKEIDNGNTPQTRLNSNVHIPLEDPKGNKKSSDGTGHNYDDDDDTLSLFAESIDLNKFNNSAVNDRNTRETKSPVVFRAPSPVVFNASPSVVFNAAPQKLQDEMVIETSYEDKIQNSDKHSKDIKTNKQPCYVKTKLICEKQNADSTSINKEEKLNDFGKIFVDHMVYQNKDRFSLDNSNNKINEEHLRTSEAVDNSNIKLMSLYRSAKNPIKSFVFSGICIFNLSSTCKYGYDCKFQHKDLIPSLVQIRLKQLDNEKFIQEYMLARKFSRLRDKYISLFIENCIERKLSRILMEMAIDSILKDTIKTRIYYLEIILLAFNDMDMNVCIDMLFYKFETTCLCDIFLQIIVFNQNFTRFIRVFIKLIDAKIVKHGHIEMYVSIQTLERVCILAYNESLIKCVLRIFSHTDHEIFNHALIGRFEDLLLQVNKDLYEEFVFMKKAAMSPTDSLTDENPPFQVQTCENLMIDCLLPQDINDNKRYTSPDTTRMESMIKPRNAILKAPKFEFRSDKFNRPNVMPEKSMKQVNLTPANPKADVNLCSEMKFTNSPLSKSSINHRFQRPNYNGMCRRRF